MSIKLVARSYQVWMDKGLLSNESFYVSVHVVYIIVYLLCTRYSHSMPYM